MMYYKDYRGVMRNNIMFINLKNKGNVCPIEFFEHIHISKK